ncbi:S8 family peptidase [Sinanaerobacter sp. ZZT-01]|uniref:S8 family peptidase n=1 Tax=Sinanaerobacter sp. ZZT-01 TaxID=3111540 RepID=UPI002D7938E9|nr:S8 family peptidase [Sinanaerobacter sp. ZZT-01]WRR94794.1 S8 family peptidase [Sinanaerobacter sp. ZZT-01]
MQIHPRLVAKLSASRQTLFPVIIYSKKTIYEIRDYIADSYGPIKYELPFINAVSVELSADKIDTLSKNQSIRLISDDPLVSKIGEKNTKPLLNRPDIPLKTNYDKHRLSKHEILSDKRHGQNVGIAIIDTGVAPHYDLVYPQNRIIAFKDFIEHQSVPYDDDGHGTHVAGIAAGNGFVSERFAGTAPAADIISIKALNGDGNGTTSDILAAMQWVINNRRLYGIRVINLSLGVPTDPSYEEDPLIKGANAAVHHGITVVAAAGNNGPDRCTINSPATSPYVITVGAADFASSPSVAPFSSRGPTPSGVVKPDLLAPGVDIVSLDATNPKGYVIQSGTSMAAPVVSGAAACLYALYPKLTPMEVKRILMRNTLPLQRTSSNAQGRGILNYEVFFDL